MQDAEEKTERDLLEWVWLPALQVMENDEGGVAGTLLAAVDHTVTGPGRRLLRRWLARPLGRPSAIRRRQDAVAALLGDCADAAREARAKLRCELSVIACMLLSLL